MNDLTKEKWINWKTEI